MDRTSSSKLASADEYHFQIQIPVEQEKVGTRALPEISSIAKSQDARRIVRSRPGYSHSIDFGISAHIPYGIEHGY